MRHLLDTPDFSIEEIDNLMLLALDIINNRDKYRESCKYKKLATLFYEPSTRTRLSFEAAMLELGGTVLGFSDAANSSVSKGETVADTIRIISSYADIAAMRHHKEGAPFVATQYSRIPVINAGDGGHAHPTQTLTDLLTIRRELGRFDNLTIGLCGDLKYGRTVHSLVKAISRYSGIRFIFIAPYELRMPRFIIDEECTAKDIEYKELTSMEEAMPELDVLYMTRVQQERFADKNQYQRLKDTYILDTDKMALAKKDMIVLHPLPRVNEIAYDVDSDPRAAYFRQAENGKFVRMALIHTLLSDNMLSQTQKCNSHTHSTQKCTNTHCITTVENLPQINNNGRCSYCEH